MPKFIFEKVKGPWSNNQLDHFKRYFMLDYIFFNLIFMLDYVRLILMLRLVEFYIFSLFTIDFST